MAPKAQEIAQLVDLLPETDQTLALELVKKLVLAWDPDFTKVTPEEAAALALACEEIENGETVSHNEINWD